MRPKPTIINLPVVGLLNRLIAKQHKVANRKRCQADAVSPVEMLLLQAEIIVVLLRPWLPQGLVGPADAFGLGVGPHSTRTLLAPGTTSVWAPPVLRNPNEYPIHKPMKACIRRRPQNWPIENLLHFFRLWMSPFLIANHTDNVDYRHTKAA